MKLNGGGGISSVHKLQYSATPIVKRMRVSRRAVAMRNSFTELIPRIC